MSTQTSDVSQSAVSLPSAFSGLSPLAESLAQVDAELVTLSQGHGAAIQQSARKIRRQIREFEPSITMIGQVKAGKTTLVNAMVGWADLLPADVNPWTSVVTSLHLQGSAKRNEKRAAFQFFSNEEWDNLIRRGGRVGEMANRAGAEDELEKVRRQLDEMREKSQARLGRRFQMLMGQTHEYETFDEDLIERYVCMGDDFWEDDDVSREQGRFADITKSADLWFNQPDLPLNLCVQDTPGVNDTFMIREQITINALRGSRLCVMVLSAQQALSSVDLGLIRLISNVQSRDVIIFVNRIDELSNPSEEVPQIESSILETLRKFDGPKDVQIIFGSGYWASHAAAGTVENMAEESSAALLNWAESQANTLHGEMEPYEYVWSLSGVPALGQAISERIEKGEGAKLLDRLNANVTNLRMGLESRRGFEALGEIEFYISSEDIAQHFEIIESRAMDTLQTALSRAEALLADRVEKAHQTFLGRATSSLIDHLDTYGEKEIWTYDPSGLRILLRSAFQVFVRGATRSAKDANDQAARDMETLFQEAFRQQNDEHRISPPPIATAPAPVSLGQTIALDLKGNWWTRFWRKRRGYSAFFDDFSRLVHEETQPIVDSLKEQNATQFTKTLEDDLRGFIASQRDLMIGLSKPSGEIQTDHMRREPTLEDITQTAKLQWKTG